MKYKERGMALISIVISLLIAAIIIYIALSMYTGGKTNESETIISPIEKGKSAQCLSQIRRIEMAIQMYLAENDSYPSSLNGLKYLTEQDFYCPVTNNPYRYDPSTGKVTCLDHDEK